MNDRDFEANIAPHMPALRSYARALTDRSCDADDAIAETLARAWRYADGFTGHGSFEGWLLRICRNCVIDARRRAARSREAETAAGVIPITPSPAGLVELHDVLHRLPVAQRELIVLTAVFGYSYEECAELLDTPIGTVRSRLHRARASFSSLLAGNEHRSEGA